MKGTQVTPKSSTRVLAQVKEGNPTDVPRVAAKSSSYQHTQATVIINQPASSTSEVFLREQSVYKLYPVVYDEPIIPPGSAAIIRPVTRSQFIHHLIQCKRIPPT